MEGKHQDLIVNNPFQIQFLLENVFQVSALRI